MEKRSAWTSQSAADLMEKRQANTWAVMGALERLQEGVEEGVEVRGVPLPIITETDVDEDVPVRTRPEDSKRTFVVMGLNMSSSTFCYLTTSKTT